VLAEQAAAALRPLVIATDGWTQEAITYYVDELVRLEDGEALAAACVAVARWWKAGRRPPLAEVLDAYRVETQRRAALAPRELTEGRVVDLAAARLIASQAYAAECVRQGREPNWTTFERVLGGVPG
jgi:hypothetical protein